MVFGRQIVGIVSLLGPLEGELGVRVALEWVEAAAVRVVLPQLLGAPHPLRHHELINIFRIILPSQVQKLILSEPREVRLVLGAVDGY